MKARISGAVTKLKVDGVIESDKVHAVLDEDGTWMVLIKREAPNDRPLKIEVSAGGS